MSLEITPAVTRATWPQAPKPVFPRVPRPTHIPNQRVYVATDSTHYLQGLGALPPPPAGDPASELKTSPDARPSAVQLQAMQKFLQGISAPLAAMDQRIMEIVGGAQRLFDTMSDAWQLRIAKERAFVAKVIESYGKRAEAVYATKDPKRWNDFIERALIFIRPVIDVTLRDMERGIKQASVPAGVPTAYRTAASDLNLSAPSLPKAGPSGGGVDSNGNTDYAPWLLGGVGALGAWWLWRNRRR
jgi:hypothetical protein